MKFTSQKIVFAEATFDLSGDRADHETQQQNDDVEREIDAVVKEFDEDDFAQTRNEHSRGENENDRTSGGFFHAGGSVQSGDIGV